MENKSGSADLLGHLFNFAHEPLNELCGVSISENGA